jgi:hypothetical protein
MLHINQDTSVRPRSFPFPIGPSAVRTLKLSLLASSCSSKGPLSHSPGSMFLFWITTIIFILSTTFMVFGPGLTSQLNLLAIQFFDATTFERIWSPHKINVVSVIIAVITRLVVRFPPSLIWPLVVNNERSVLFSRSSATWFVRGEPWFYGSMIGESSPSFPSACLEPLVCTLG